MIREINLEDVAKRAHQVNVDNGFWDPIPPIERSIVLMYGELFEALEADRKGKWFRNVPEFEIMKRVFYGDQFDETIFKNHIKDTVEDELADTVIRYLDIFAGYFGATGLFTYVNEQHYMPLYEFVHDAMTHRPDEHDIPILVSDLFSYCEREGIDLMWHIEMKIKYNSLREYRHGKAY